MFWIYSAAQAVVQTSVLVPDQDILSRADKRPQKEHDRVASHDALHEKTITPHSSDLHLNLPPLTLQPNVSYLQIADPPSLPYPTHSIISLTNSSYIHASLF